jgi:outer membrane protein TolC
MPIETLPIAQPIHGVRARLAILACVLVSGSSSPLLPATPQVTEDTPSAPSAVHLTLSGAIHMALQHNHQIELAHLAVKQTEAQRKLAESHFYPILKNESAVLHVTELQGVVIPAGALGQTTTGFLPPVTLTIDQGAATSYTSGTQLTQPITQAFKIKAGVKAADADLQSARLQSQDAENGIALLIHKLYYGILIEQSRSSAAQDEVSAATAFEEETKRGVDEGKLLPDTELLARTDLLNKQQATLVSHLELNDLVLQLDDALGLPLGTHLDLDPITTESEIPLPARQGAVALILSTSPTVLSARQTVEKAKAGVTAARTEYIPDVTGVARYSYQSGLPFLAHNFGTFGATVTYNLFDGGGREARLRDAQIKLSMAQTELAQIENSVRIELSSAYDKCEQLRQLVGVASQAQQAREESLRIQSERSKVDAQLSSVVAAARAAVTSAHVDVLNARLNLYLVQADIQRKLGRMPQ